MKVLVTGATSGLGRNAAQWLQEQNSYHVHAMGRNVTVGDALQKQGMGFTAMNLGYADNAPAKLDGLMQSVDWVWHCAALSSPWGQWADFYKSNVLATEQLATRAGQAGVKRFVHISTPSLYFDFQHRKNIPESFITPKFANHYVKSKVMAEQVIQHAQQQFPETQYIILRPRGIFGVHDRVILPRVLQQIKQGKGILKLPRGGAAFLDLTFALNVVHALYLASTQSLPKGAIYNITNQEPQVLSTMLKQLLGEELGMDFSIKALPYPLLYGVATGMEKLALLTGKEPMLTRYSIGALNFDMTLCCEKAKTELGYHPIYTLDEGIKLTAAWLKTQKEFALPFLRPSSTGEGAA